MINTTTIPGRAHFRLRLNHLSYRKRVVDKGQVMQIIVNTIAELGLQRWFITNNELAARFEIDTGKKIYVSCPGPPGSMEVRGFIVQFISQENRACSSHMHLLEMLDLVALFRYSAPVKLMCLIDRYSEMIKQLGPEEISLLVAYVMTYTHFTRAVVARGLKALGKEELSSQIMNTFIPATYRKYKSLYPFFFE